MTRAVILFTAATLWAQAIQAATPVAAVDARLMSNCAARTDARMESMTLRKLEQIRNYEFSLRMAMTQFAAGSENMSAAEWQQATMQLHEARYQFAQVCEVSVPV